MKLGVFNQYDGEAKLIPLLSIEYAIKPKDNLTRRTLFLDNHHIVLEPILENEAIAYLKYHFQVLRWIGFEKEQSI